ncbi:MAG: hypothetical protein V3575_05480, partial [Candidatus Absconditabacteria bacterium]
KTNVIKVLESKGFDKQYLEKIINFEIFISSIDPNKLKKYFTEKFSSLIIDLYSTKDSNIKEYLLKYSRNSGEIIDFAKRVDVDSIIGIIKAKIDICLNSITQRLLIIDKKIKKDENIDTDLSILLESLNEFKVKLKAGNIDQYVSGTISWINNLETSVMNYNLYKKDNFTNYLKTYGNTLFSFSNIYNEIRKSLVQKFEYNSTTNAKAIINKLKSADKLDYIKSFLKEIANHDLKLFDSIKPFIEDEIKNLTDSQIKIKELFLSMIETNNKISFVEKDNLKNLQLINFINLVIFDDAKLIIDEIFIKHNLRTIKRRLNDINIILKSYSLEEKVFDNFYYFECFVVVVLYRIIDYEGFISLQQLLKADSKDDTFKIEILNKCLDGIYVPPYNKVKNFVFNKVYFISNIQDNENKYIIILKQKGQNKNVDYDIYKEIILSI